MLVQHVALVSEDSKIKMSELMAVAAALEKQATRDFAPLWNVPATVTAFESLDDLPLDYWPIIIKDDIGDPSAAGYHEDKNGEPFALVQYADGWPLTTSHELLEMLADPFGRRMVAGPSPKAGQGRVKFLVEVCDPCEDDKFAYTINGIKVSDFYTPHYFDPTDGASRYSYTGAITKPRQVLRGGYLSWYHPPTKTWWQRTWFGTKASDDKLDLKIVNGNVRAAVDRHTEAMRAKAQRRSMRPLTAARRTTVVGYTPEKNLGARAQELRAAVRGVMAAASRR